MLSTPHAFLPLALIEKQSNPNPYSRNRNFIPSAKKDLLSKVHFKLIYYQYTPHFRKQALRGLKNRQ